MGVVTLLKCGVPRAGHRKSGFLSGVLLSASDGEPGHRWLPPSNKYTVFLVCWWDGAGVGWRSDDAVSDPEFFRIAFLPWLTHVVSLLHLHPWRPYCRRKRVREEGPACWVTLFLLGRQDFPGSLYPVFCCDATPAPCPCPLPPPPTPFTSPPARRPTACYLLSSPMMLTVFCSLASPTKPSPFGTVCLSVSPPHPQGPSTFFKRTRCPFTNTSNSPAAWWICLPPGEGMSGVEVGRTRARVGLSGRRGDGYRAGGTVGAT